MGSPRPGSDCDGGTGSEDCRKCAWGPWRGTEAQGWCEFWNVPGQRRPEVPCVAYKATDAKGDGA